MLEKGTEVVNSNIIWGLGIGDWAPIPNPQSPIQNYYIFYIFNIY